MASKRLPLVAILRGITPKEIVSVGEALVAAGVEMIEVPLNSPDPFSSIEMLVAACGEHAMCGAGTVTTVEQIERLNDIGAELVVSPHTNEALVTTAIELEMTVMPGVVTPTEAMAAIDAGAEHLKLFPAGDLGPGYLGSIKEILPKRVKVFAVGRIGIDDLRTYWDAGAQGFGIGSGLYRPGDTAKDVAAKAARYVELMKVIENENG